MLKAIGIIYATIWEINMVMAFAIAYQVGKEANRQGIRKPKSSGAELAITVFRLVIIAAIPVLHIVTAYLAVVHTETAVEKTLQVLRDEQGD